VIRWYIASILLAITIGAAAGVLTSQRLPVKAADEIIIDIHPGPEDADPHYMNCGWHAVCESPWTTGRAIDFKNPEDDDVVWRSDTNFSGSSSSTLVGSATITSSTSGCNTIFVDILDG
jgi:hypothetical protein